MVQVISGAATGKSGGGGAGVRRAAATTVQRQVRTPAARVERPARAAQTRDVSRPRAREQRQSGPAVTERVERRTGTERRIVRGGGGREGSNTIRRGRPIAERQVHRGTRYNWGPGAIFYFYDGYYHGDCAWLRRKAISTGSEYWRRRYRQCRALND